MGTIKGVSLIFGNEIGVNPLGQDIGLNPPKDAPEEKAAAVVANDAFVNADESPTDQSLYENLINGKA